MSKKKITMLLLVTFLLFTSSTVAAINKTNYVEKNDVFHCSMETSNHDIYDFDRAIILAASTDDYVAATPLAAKQQIPLILVSEPVDRIQYFIDLYDPHQVYELGETIFDAVALSEDDLIVEEEESSNEYVVIAKEQGEFSIVGEYLASLHHGKIIYAETLEDPLILEQLREINPYYCALVWNPDEFQCHVFVKQKIWLTCSICQSTMPQFLLNQLARIDNDPYIDVSFGFITGGDVTDATLLLARELVYEQLSGDWKNKALFFPQRNDAQPICEIGGLEYIEKTDDEYSAQVYLDSVKNGVKYACFFGHGDPLTLLFDTSSNPNNPESSSLISCPDFYDYLIDKGKNAVYLPDNLSIEPTIVINEACVTGLTGMMYDSITNQPLMYECDDLRNHSMSLKMVRSGASAYIGSSTIGGVGGIEPYLMASAYNWSLGDIVTHENNKLISTSLWMVPLPLTIYKYDPRVVLFGDPSFNPSLPLETTKEDFYEVETVETSIGGTEQTSVVTIIHLKEDIEFSFGKVEITRASADMSAGFKWCNKFICYNKIFNMKEFVDERNMGHRLEEDHGRIYLSWDVMYPDIRGNSLNIFVTPERPLFYSIE